MYNPKFNVFISRINLVIGICSISHKNRNYFQHKKPIEKIGISFEFQIILKHILCELFYFLSIQSIEKVVDSAINWSMKRGN